jgi:hypothetical protein
VFPPMFDFAVIFDNDNRLRLWSMICARFDGRHNKRGRWTIPPPHNAMTIELPVKDS